MSRQPIYADDRKKRVISIHGGRWVAQHFTAGPRGGMGQNHAKTKKEELPHFDPWQDIAPPTEDRSRALARIADKQQQARV